MRNHNDFKKATGPADRKAVMLWRFAEGGMQNPLRSGFCLFLLFGLVAGTARAQTPPDEASAAALGPTAVQIMFKACQVSDPEDPNSNCYLEFSIYRDPPGLSQGAIWDGLVNADQSTHTVIDSSVKAQQTYTYQVCGGGLANSDRSNCTKAFSVKTPAAYQSSNNSNNNDNSNNSCCSKWSPPQNLQATAGTVANYLKWTNPANTPGPPQDITVLRQDRSGWWYILKDLSQAANNFKLNTSYTDPGPFLPHSLIAYAVCEGYPAPFRNNCSVSKFLTTWGADPILLATRTGATSVRLGLVVDDIYNLEAASVTREGSDDPCRQSTTLGNGNRACLTQSYGSNGVARNAPNIVTVYEQSNGIGFNSASPPWVVNIPDDNGVSAGVEYYYQGHATWGGSTPPKRDSEIVTVPKWSRQIVPPPVNLVFNNGIKPIKPPGQMPPVAGARSPQTMVRAAPATISNPAPANLEAAITAAQQKPGDSQALYALGQAYCAARLKSACVSVLYMGYLRAGNSGNAALSSAIRGSLAQQGVTLSAN